MKKTAKAKKPERKREMKSMHQTPANPEKFGERTTGVRERMAKEIKTMDPDERIRRGR